jgi:hypothetical protein
MAKIAFFSNKKHFDGWKYQISLKLSLKGHILKNAFIKLQFLLKIN